MHRIATFATLLVALVAPVVRAVDPMVQVGVDQTDEVADIEAGAVQANGKYGYVTCHWSPACVGKYRNNAGGAAPTYLGRLEMQNDEDNAENFFFTDATEAYGVFTVRTFDYDLFKLEVYVAKVALYPDTNTLPTRVGISPVVSSWDADGNGLGPVQATALYGDFMYLATRTGYIVKVAVGTGATLPSLVSTSAVPGPFTDVSGQMVVNGPLGMLYVGARSPSPSLGKYSTGVAGGAPVYQTLLALPGAPKAGAIDVANDIAYWCLETDPGQVVKIKLNSDDPTAAPEIIGALTLDEGEEYPYSIALDLVNGFGYVGTVFGKLIRINLNGNGEAPTRQSTLELDPPDQQLTVAAYNAATGMLYMVSYDDPSTYYKLSTGVPVPDPPAPPVGEATLMAAGPKRPVARGAKVTVHLTLTMPGVTKAAKGAPKLTKTTAFYAVTLNVPEGIAVLKASIPLGAGNLNKAVVDGAHVTWPRVPLKVGRTTPQKVHLKLTAQVGMNAVSPLQFDATAENLDTRATVTAEPSPLEVGLK